MRIYIQASKEQKSELELVTDGKTNIVISECLPIKEQLNNFNAFLILSENSQELDYTLFEEKPVFINEVILTLNDLGTPKNVWRINAWPTFLKRETWEVTGTINEEINEIFKLLGKNFIMVKDTPGLISARVISMIVNEAFYALKEQISTRKEIDLAMKLGTNYPYGPFEWSDIIGQNRIHNLLLKLSQTDARCIPSFEKIKTV